MLRGSAACRTSIPEEAPLERAGAGSGFESSSEASGKAKAGLRSREGLKPVPILFVVQALETLSAQPRIVPLVTRPRLLRREPRRPFFRGGIVALRFRSRLGALRFRHRPGAV